MTYAAGIYAASSQHDMRRDGPVPDGGAPQFGPTATPQPPPGYQHVRDPRRRLWDTEPPGYAPTSPSPWADDARYATPRALTALERAMPDLREQVVERLNTLNWDHARTAWERRRRDPLSPHVLLFFYADPDATQGHTWFTLRVAARLFLASDEPNLAKLLAEFQRATGPQLDARLDPRSPELSNWSDAMSAGAVYLGVGVSSLDTDDVSWQRTQRDAISDMGVPGQCYVTLSDDTKLLIHRRAVNDFGDITVTTNRPHSEVMPARRWRWQYLPQHADPTTTDRTRFNIWDQLDALHHRILGVPHA